jgi:alpha-amylase/alpha-mannosidase (GH57 family)
MSSRPLKLAFLWHMHQPYYKNPRTNIYGLPWVRLHTVKDYYDMAARLAEYPRIKATFNFVPCLVEQILDYAEGDVTEIHLELSRKPAETLTRDEKVSIIRHFFLGSRRAMIEPYSRYRSLLEKRQDLGHDYKVDAAVRRFKMQDYLDLQVWSNLAWMGSMLQNDPVVRSLLSRGRHFTQDMKISLLDKQLEVMRSVIGRYKQLVQSGNAEISTSPYFHPMLPLICESKAAVDSVPGTRLPEQTIGFPDDAEAQIRMGRELHEKAFGSPPEGLWPPEAGVSDMTLDLLARHGAKWSATDEKVLEKTIGTDLRKSAKGGITRPDLLYKPYKFKGSGGEVVVFFRDRLLSDLIGFEYAKMPSEDAVEDFISRLLGIRSSLEGDLENSVVVVALDGENHWEDYDRGGDEFLRGLYEGLSACKEIETVLLSEIAAGASSAPVLERVHPGSWIRGDFNTWIGHRDDNKAWDMLASARAELVSGASRLSEADRRDAWRSIFAAEGSDWFWWYGGEHTCLEETEFDALFRAHIRQVYELLGAHVPHRVLQPVMADRGGAAISYQPTAVLRPTLDGRITTFYEWKLAGLYESYRDSSRGVFGRRILNAIYFGFNHERLYFRLDASISPQTHEFTHLALRIEFEDPSHHQITVRAPAPRAPGNISLTVVPSDAAPHVEAVALENVEIAVAFGLLGAKPGDPVTFRVAVLKDDKIIEHRPVHEVIRFTLPTPEFDAEMWSTL